MSGAAAAYESTPTPPHAFRALTKTPPPIQVHGVGRAALRALELARATGESMRALRARMIRDGEMLAADG